MPKFNGGSLMTSVVWSSQEREGWNLADQLIKDGRQVDQRFGGVERVIANIERTAAMRPEGYRAGIQKRIEVERHGNC